MSEPVVEHDTANQRFVIRLPEATAELRYTRVEPGLLDLHHTEVPAALRGQGIAGRLVRGAVSQIRAAGDRIIPSCPYVATWMERHPEEGDLIARRG